MADAPLYLKAPNGDIVTIPQAQAQAAADAGYTALTPEALRGVQTTQAEAAPAGAPNGLVPDTSGGYDPATEFTAKAVSGATFGLAERDVRSGATAARYSKEHPYASAAASMLGQAPAMLAGGAAGAAVRGGVEAAAGGLAARAGAVAADYGINAGVAGAQIEGDTSHEEGRDFSFTDAALAGVTTEILGRGAAGVISKGVGGARNLIARAASDAVKDGAERSLTKGGVLADYRVAQHADVYHNELADLGAKDLDTLETSTAEVSRQDKKRSRIMASVVENPPAQHEINVSAVEGLQRLRGALEGELADATGGPAKRLSKQLDDRITALEAAPKGRKLWRILDENRQALQEYRQDLHQAYSDNPGSAWLSREGLAAIDAAEESTRTALLREDAWGEAAARMQREYNVPFHEKWFPARQTVLKDLHFATGKDAQGFTTYRGEPGKVRSFLTGLGGAGPDVHRLGEQFTQYLDGAESIARAGERDSPAAARDALESVRRLRKNVANSAFINEAAARAARRGAVAGAVGDLAAGATGLVLGGPGGAAGGILASRFVRSARVGDWFANVAKHLGVFHGTAESMAELLAHGRLPAAPDAAEALSERLTGDILDAPFPLASDVPRGVEHPPIAGQPQRPVGVAAPPEPPTGPFPGPGQVGRQETPRRPAGMEAITPQSVRGVGPEAPPPPPGGGGWQRMAAPTGGVSEFSVGESALQSEHQALNAPLPGEAHVNETPTFQTPTRTAGAADLEARLAPHLGAQSAEAARMQALTEGEFAHVVDGLNATGQKAPDGKTLLGDFLRSHADELKTVGLIAAGTGASAAAAQYENQPDVAGAAGGLGLALLAGRTGKRLPGSWFAAARGEVKTAVHALEKLGFETSAPVASMLTKTFRDKMPGTVELEKMMPIRALEALGGPAAEQKIVKLGGDVHWYAEGAEGPVPPHDVHLPDGTIDHDPGGYPAPSWKMARTFTREPNGDLIVHHDYFYLRHDLQGTGAGAEILKHQMEAYRGLGVKTVEVSADDVGRYFWPSIGFDSADKRVVDKAIAAYRRWVVDSGRAEAGPELTRQLTAIRSLPGLANAEFGKDFLLSTRGDWNLHLELNLNDADPRFHLMRHRLGLGETVLGGGLALAGAIEGKDPGRASADGTDTASAGAGGAGMGFIAAAALFRQARTRLVSDVARRMFSPAVGRAVARLAARQVYSRAELSKRNQEFRSWQSNPQELVDRVAEGLRDVPPAAQPAAHAGVFRAAAFLKEHLPTSTKPNAIAMRDIPVSTEQLTKYARYEDAALRPADAWKDAAGRGHISEELMETTEALHPDLLAELRVQAYMTVRDEGPPVTVQARLQYAKLFGGDGSFADPAMGADVAAMTALAYQQAVPTKTGGGPASTSGGQSHIAAASSTPAGLAKLG